MRRFFVCEQVVRLLVDVFIEPLLVHMYDVVHGSEKGSLITSDDALGSPPQARMLVGFGEKGVQAAAMAAQRPKLPQSPQNAPTHADVGRQRFFRPSAVHGDGSDLGLDCGEVEALPAGVALEEAADVPCQSVGIARPAVARPDALDRVAMDAKVSSSHFDVAALEVTIHTVREEEMHDGNTSLGGEVRPCLGRLRGLRRHDCRSGSVGGMRGAREDAKVHVNDWDFETKIIRACNFASSSSILPLKKINQW